VAPRFGPFALAFACAASLLSGAIPPALAQTASPAAAAANGSSAQRTERNAPENKVALEVAKELVAPIALYPDPVLAAVLEAATTPLDIVEAERFLAKREKDPGLRPDADWSPAVVALLNHPDLLRRMSEDLDWTRTLGAAVVEDLPVVQEAIQTVRRGAVALGLLADDAFQRIVREDDLIAIEPVDPDRVRLPVYDAKQLLAAMPREPTGEPAGSPTPATAALAAGAGAEPEPPAPRPKPAPPPVSAEAIPPPASTAYVPPPVPPAAYEPYPAVPAAPPPTVTYAEPQRSFWSDAAIFAGGAALGGVLGYLLADRDDDKKIVKKYYYFGDRHRPPGWWQGRLDWYDHRPGARIVKVDKIVIKDSDVLISGNDIVVRNLRDRRGGLVALVRPGESEPLRWTEWGSRGRGRPEPVVRTSDPKWADRPAIAVLPEQRGRARSDELRQESRPKIAVLPDRRSDPGEDRGRRKLGEGRQPAPALLPPAGVGTGSATDAGEAARRAAEEQRRLERQRLREQAAEAERRARAQRGEELRLKEEQRARAEAAAREERRRAIEQQRLERARAAELARAEELRRRHAAEEQAELLRRQRAEIERLERQRAREERRSERPERRGGQSEEGKKKRLWQEG